MELEERINKEKKYIESTMTMIPYPEDIYIRLDYKKVSDTEFVKDKTLLKTRKYDISFLFPNKEVYIVHYIGRVKEDE